VGPALLNRGVSGVVYAYKAAFIRSQTTFPRYV
jgi:hypothetical protein